MAYKLKIVLGKRQYRRGPKESKMTNVLDPRRKYDMMVGGDASKKKRARKVGRKLGY